jgi:hypothetical protein
MRVYFMYLQCFKHILNVTLDVGAVVLCCIETLLCLHPITCCSYYEIYLYVASPFVDLNVSF